jgi:hypothetical protein
VCISRLGKRNLLYDLSVFVSGFHSCCFLNDDSIFKVLHNVVIKCTDVSEQRTASKFRVIDRFK